MHFRNFLISFDVFGEPVSLNYDGDSTYKTVIGAIFSLVIKSFLLIYATQQLVALANYEDSQLTIVSYRESAPIIVYFIVVHKIFDTIK